MQELMVAIGATMCHPDTVIKVYLRRISYVSLYFNSIKSESQYTGTYIGWIILLGKGINFFSRNHQLRREDTILSYEDNSVLYESRALL